MAHHARPILSRRRLVCVAGAAVGATLLAGCGEDESETVTTGADRVLVHTDTDNGYEAMFAGFEAADEPEGDPDAITWPAFVLDAPPEIGELYAFHVTNGWVMRYMPCFCGCNAGSGHMNNRDCYIKAVRPDGSVTFDAMAPT